MEKNVKMCVSILVHAWNNVSFTVLQSNWPIAEKEGILNKDLYSKTKMKRLIILEKTYSYETLYVLNSNGHGHNFKQKKIWIFYRHFQQSTEILVQVIELKLSFRAHNYLETCWSFFVYILREESKYQV